MASQDRFGYEWERYNQLDPMYKEQFDNWIGPLSKENFNDKYILDAGCGMGRNSFWALKYGARRVVAFDYDMRSVGAAKSNLKNFKNAEVYFKDIYKINWKDEFDTVLCIGVMHHLKDPKTAIKNLFMSLKNGGTLIVWVYSYEGNEWIVRYIDPVRKHITSKLPPGLVHAFSYLLSAPLWMFVRTFKQQAPYLKALRRFRFWHITSIVFDQLIPEVSNYWRKNEVERLFKDCGILNYQVFRPQNESGWTIIVKK